MLPYIFQIIKQHGIILKRNDEIFCINNYIFFLLTTNTFEEAKYKKTEFKIDDLVSIGYRLYEAELNGEVVGQGTYILTKETASKRQSIFHCYVLIKAIPKKLEICYNLTPSIIVN